MSENTENTEDREKKEEATVEEISPGEGIEEEAQKSDENQ
jgi:hypothetical protein